MWVKVCFFCPMVLGFVAIRAGHDPNALGTLLRGDYRFYFRNSGEIGRNRYVQSSRLNFRRRRALFARKLGGFAAPRENHWVPLTASAISTPPIVLSQCESDDQLQTYVPLVKRWKNLKI